MKPLEACGLSIVLGLCLEVSACSDANQFLASSTPTKVGADAVGEAENPDPLSSLDDPLQTTRKASVTASPRNSTDMPQDASPTLSPSEIQRLVTLCQTKPHKTLIQSIQFPENNSCSWDQDGNLGRRDLYLQAIALQSGTIEIPEGAQVCGLKLESAASTLHYDDFIVLTLNDSVLLSSNRQILNRLTGDENKTYHWDFERIRGIAVNFESPAYCAGNSICDVPRTDRPGRFQLGIDPSRLSAIAEKLLGRHQLDFTLISTGDNDNRDCYHTAFSIEFQLQYIEDTATATP